MKILKITGLLLVASLMLTAGTAWRLESPEAPFYGVVPFFAIAYLMAAAVTAASFGGAYRKLMPEGGAIWKLWTLGTAYYLLWSGFFVMILACI